MAAKSKLTIRPIHWSLLLKPLAVAAAWLVLPWWGFLIVALYCYLVPFFRVATLVAPFLIFLFLALVIPSGFPQAVYAALILILIFGIKDLVIVNRKAAYELLTFLLSFAGFLLFFDHFAAWSTPFSFGVLALTILLWLWLARSAPERQSAAVISAVPASAAALILFEIGAVIFFLPLSFFSQAALLFFGSALSFELTVDAGSFTAKRFSIWGGAYAAITFLAVFLTPWKI